MRPAEIVSVRGTSSVQRWYRLTIRTRHEQFQFTGFSWFYYGSGRLPFSLFPAGCFCLKLGAAASQIFGTRAIRTSLIAFLFPLIRRK
ncbi:hypothetical protein [Paenibacillus polymyxa]|uniref:hypothetical protein n=1 Tax=Paenibacillus polymyxa TaxID=1406 RepID=UPI0025B6D6B6|nr:hypothetical protein [Paenibacillus polymyxa]